MNLRKCRTRGRAGKLCQFGRVQFLIRKLGAIKYFISNLQMQQLLNRLEEVPNNRQELRRTCKQNQLPITMLNGFKNQKLRAIYHRLIRHYEDHPDKAKTLWFENELKIFFWVAIALSLLKNKNIREFADEQWLEMKRIFFEKDVYTFQYETRRILTPGKKNSRVWSSEENELLHSIMSDESLKNRWNEVARLFYMHSGHRYFRTGKQCREHWLNHLDPSKRHDKWTQQEDYQIVKFVYKNGKRWSLISRENVAHRTEHMIKNRFKALYEKAVRMEGSAEFDEHRVIKKMLKKYESPQESQASSSQLLVKEEPVEGCREQEPLKKESRGQGDSQKLIGPDANEQENPPNNIKLAAPSFYPFQMPMQAQLVNIQGFMIPVYDFSPQKTLTSISQQSLTSLSPWNYSSVNFGGYRQ